MDVETSPPSFAQSMVFKVTLICFALTALSITLRLWSKLRTGKREFGFDDAAMLVSFFFYIWFCGVALKVAIIEMKHPILTHKVADEFLMQLTIGEGVFLLSTVSLKLSLMLFYRQFVWQKWQRHAIVLAGVCSIALSFVAFFLCMFQCGTLNNLANKHIEDRCIARNRYVPLLYVHGATGAITDWIFALLPIAVLVKSNLPIHIKFSVCALLALGVTGSLAACFRTVYVYGIYFDAQFLNPTHRPTFYDHSAPEILTALIELGFGIAAASMACLQPLLRHFVHRAKSWFETCKNLYSGRSTGITTNPRSTAGLLPFGENRCQRGVADMPPLPRKVAEVVHGGRRQSTCKAGSKHSSLHPNRKPSIGCLPSVDSITGSESEDHSVAPVQNSRLRWRNSIGVLPSIATIDDEQIHQSEEGMGMTSRCTSSLKILPCLTTVKVEEIESEGMDSWAAIAKACKSKDVAAVQ